MTEQAADEVHVERARDGLAEEERVDRRRLARRGRQRLHGEVMPRRVRDDVGGQRLCVEHVASSLRSPEREVQEERTVRTALERAAEDAERILRTAGGPP